MSTIEFVPIPTPGHTCAPLGTSYNPRCNGCLAMAWAEERSELERLRHERLILRAALGEVVWAATEMLAGGEQAIRHTEQCSECGCGGVGPLRDALKKAHGLVPVPPIGEGEPR